ncbi:aspartoacylase-like [Carcharodon carcharias]|uniref:aspartoacylase-like n=1 Tax=Carcharodon carcharias TaxID=13397 RepID=UPI001B7ED96F|nr:aspartoacylase-like [Carcharodon carcharias]
MIPDVYPCLFFGCLSVDSDQTLPYEGLRAKRLNCLLGPRGSEEAMDLIIDLHNTTANVGDCLILNSSSNHFSNQLAAYIQDVKSCLSGFLQRNLNGLRCRVLALELRADKLYDITSVGKNDLGIELGPQPQGVARAETLARMRQIVKVALDFVELFNQGTEFEECDLEIYRQLKNLDFPRDAQGEISALIHPDRQDQDWVPLNPGDPMFLTLGGETITYSGNKTVYPVFINEAAYYEKRTAFSMTERVSVRLPRIHREGKSS